MDRRLPLFVFGTLRRGECNHGLLEGRYEQVLPAVLHDYRLAEPLMIEPVPGGVVRGELYFIHTPVYEVTLADCDALEEIPFGELVGDEYERRSVIVLTNDGRHEAWAYVRPGIPRQL